MRFSSDSTSHDKEKHITQVWTIILELHKRFHRGCAMVLEIAAQDPHSTFNVFKPRFFLVSRSEATRATEIFSDALFGDGEKSFREV